VYVGREDKLGILHGWCDALGITPTQVAFIGDDVNDLSMIAACGLSACPSDAAASVKDVADLVLTTAGGEGCVREFVERWLHIKVIY
jgi:3-deoxy-D-manno-octulosonate 8-phosphate phosphatase (KDO 8-P phosphatase)